MRLVRHYSFAFTGGFLAMSAHVYWLYGRGDWLSPQRLDNTISAALIFAHLFALTVMLARDLFHEKSTFLSVSLRLIGSIVCGTLAWFAHVFLFLYQTTPNFLILIFGGIALSTGFFVTGLPAWHPRLRAVFGIIIATIAVYAAIFITRSNYVADSMAQALLYFQPDNPNDVYLIGLPFALTLAVIPNLPLLFSSSPTVKIESHLAPDHE